MCNTDHFEMSVGFILTDTDINIMDICGIVFSHAQVHWYGTLRPPIARLKYFSSFWMDCHKMLYKHSWYPEDKSYFDDLLTFLGTMSLTFVSKYLNNYMNCGHICYRHSCPAQDELQ